MQRNGSVDDKQTIHGNTLNRLASIGQLSAGIAHEVRNPLTSVKGFLQLLQKEVPHAYTEIALSELDRAIDTLSNLLQVAKPDLDDEPFTWISLYTEIELILYLFQDKMYNITVHHNCQNKNELVYGKRNQLKKAFFNLLKNAFEAISDKGEIEIQQYQLDESLILVIRDTGIGIPEEKLNLLGTPFYTTKADGTGMGLAQVFSTIYQHGASIEVKSKIGSGTTFTISFPITKKINIGVKLMELDHINTNHFTDFYLANQEKFHDTLIQEAEQSYQIIKEKASQSIDLFDTIHKLVFALEEGKEYKLVALAKQHGVDWAKADLSITLKLEWIQMFRKVYWDFLYNFYKDTDFSIQQFFELERRINYTIDQFIHYFAASYSKYQSDILRSQREIIEELSVPLIPLSVNMAVLPLVGTLDTYRAKKIQERVLNQVSLLKIKRVVIDLSGVPFMDTAVVSHIFRIIDGIRLLGCKAVITGIRPEIVNTMIELDIDMSSKVVTLATLQQALEEFGLS